VKLAKVWCNGCLRLAAQDVPSRQQCLHQFDIAVGQIMSPSPSKNSALNFGLTSVIHDLTAGSPEPVQKLAPRKIARPRSVADREGCRSIAPRSI
jgi:hypothetical protein